MKTTRIAVSQHAIDRAIQHFRVDRRVAEDWVRSQFRKATFISDIVSEDGKPTRLFAFNRIAFAVADATDFILTCYPQNHAVTELSQKVRKLIERELRKAERTEQSVARHVSVAKAKLAIERAECEYRMTITPSDAVVRKNRKRISEIDEEITKLDAELLDAKKAKSAVAKSLVAFM